MSGGLWEPGIHCPQRKLLNQTAACSKPHTSRLTCCAFDRMANVASPQSLLWVVVKNVFSLSPRTEVISVGKHWKHRLWLLPCSQWWSSPSRLNCSLTSRAAWSDLGAAWRWQELTGMSVSPATCPLGAFLAVSYEKGQEWPSARSLKPRRAELYFCLELSSEPGLCAQQGSNGSSVSALTVSLHIWSLAKALLTPTQWPSIVHASHPASSLQFPLSLKSASVMADEGFIMVSVVQSLTVRWPSWATGHHRWRQTY